METSKLVKDLEHQIVDLKRKIVAVDADMSHLEEHHKNNVEPMGTVTTEKDPVPLNTLLSLTHLLQAKIYCMYQRQLQGLPDSRMYCVKSWNSEAHTSVTDLKHLICLEEAHSESLDQSTSRLRKSMQEEEMLNMRIKEQLQEEKESVDKRQDKHRTNLMTKRTSYQKMFSFLKKELNELLVKYFPDLESCGSITDILHDLMKAFLRPGDPYISVTDEMYQPYLELLDRAGIIVSHPDDPRKIRHVDFT